MREREREREREKKEEREWMGKQKEHISRNWIDLIILSCPLDLMESTTQKRCKT